MNQNSKRHTAKSHTGLYNRKNRQGGAVRFFNKLFRSRWYRTLILRYSLAVILSMICIPMTIFLLFAQPAEANDGSEEVFYKYYHRIEVMEGETLWSIAQQNYNAQSQTIREYIEEVRQINHRDGEIVYAGEELMIPYYSTEFY